MDEKLGILFLHHKSDAVVLNNLLSIYRCNPGAKVITISAADPLPGGYTLAKTPEIQKLHAKNVLKGSDWLVCSWFVQRKETCEKWWIVEWDVFCRVSAKDYYYPVWNFPFVSSRAMYHYRDPEWWWFRELSKLPDDLRPYAMGASPFLYLISEHALNAICQTLLRAPFSAGNGELRFATVANKCGFAPSAFSPPNDEITWVNRDQISENAAIFHPVKRLIPTPLAGFPLFIFGHPRSGSTLCMRLLNAIGGVYVSGKTINILWQLNRLHEEYVRVKARYSPNFPAWYCRGTEETWTNGVAELMRMWANPPPACKAWGWKEVYIARDGRGVELLTWLHEVLPNAKFIFLARDHNKVISSMLEQSNWWIPGFARSEGDIECKLANQLKTWREYNELQPLKTILLNYEDMLDFEVWLDKCLLLGLAPERSRWESETCKIQRC